MSVWMMPSLQQSLLVQVCPAMSCIGAGETGSCHNSDTLGSGFSRDMHHTLQDDTGPVSAQQRCMCEWDYCGAQSTAGLLAASLEAWEGERC